MPRGYRCILVAFVGWLSLAAANPKDATSQPDRAAQSDVSASLQNIAAALQDANKPSQHDKPCEDGRDDRSSDLCAQWKAADAARSAANANWAFGYIGTLIGLLTLAAAGAAAWYARKAAIHTQEGATAANDTLAHQIETSNRQLRAYVSIGRPTMEQFKDDRWILIFPTLNTGQTPATDVVASIACSCEPYPLNKAIIESLELKPHKVSDIAPDGQRFRYFQHDMDDVTMDLLKGRLCFAYCIQLSYTIFTGERIDDPPYWWIAREQEFAKGAPSMLDDQHYSD